MQTCLSTSGEVETFNFDMTGSVRNESSMESMPGRDGNGICFLDAIASMDCT